MLLYTNISALYVVLVDIPIETIASFQLISPLHMAPQTESDPLSEHGRRENGQT